MNKLHEEAVEKLGQLTRCWPTNKFLSRTILDSDGDVDQ
jgi:hypothetical protein